MATFVQHETDCAIADQNSVLKKASREEPVTVMGAYGDIIDASQIRIDSWSEELHCSTGPGWRSKNRFAKLEVCRSKQKSHSSTSSMEKPDSQWKSESCDSVIWMHNWHSHHCRAWGSWTESNSFVDRHGKQARTRKKDLLVLQPVSYCFWEALDYWT